MGASVSRVPTTITLAPKVAAAGEYNDPRSVTAPHFALADAIVGEVKRVSAELGKAAPVPDGRLYTTAHELAEVSPENGPLVYSLIEFALQRSGIIEPSPHLVVVWGPAGDADSATADSEVVKSLAQRLPDILRAADFARMGVGVAEREGDQEVIILAFQQSAIATGPIPRHLGAGQSATVQGSIKPPYTDPDVFVTREAGAVESMPLTRTAAGGFTTTLTCGRHVGRQQVEIAAADKSGSTVLANFPVWCGTQPPDTLTIHTDTDADAPVTSQAGAEARLARLVNRDRQAQGLPPLTIDPRLTQVARAHSEWMHSSGTVAHISPITGSAADRVRAAGINTAVVLENVARAYGIGEAEDGLMNSPGHRANILSREVTHIGIGVVLGDVVADRRELFVTQVFIRVPQAIDRDQVRTRVIDLIHKSRAIDEDRALSRVAQQLADNVAAGDNPHVATTRANAQLARMQLPYSKVTTVVTSVADLDVFRPDDGLSDRSVRTFGLGISQGDSDKVGAQAIHIVLLYGHQ